MLENVRSEWVKARKQRDEIKANLLGGVMSEINRIAKDDSQRAPTDNDAITVIKKFLKNIEDTIADLEKVGREAEKEKAEAEILSSFIPKQMDAETLTARVGEIINELGAAGNIKAMGQVMSKLKERYFGLYDGKMASEIVRKSLGA